MLNNLIKKLPALFKLDLQYFLIGGSWISSSTLISLILGLVISSLFAHLWSPTDYGQYVFATTVISFLTTITLPGIGQIITQAASENKDGIYKQSILIMTKWSTPGIIILFILSLFYYYLKNYELFLIFITSAIFFPFLNAGGLYNLFLNGKKRFKEAAILAVTAQLLTAVVTAIALIYIKNLSYVTIILLLITSCINTIFTTFSFKFIANNLIDKKLISFGYHLSLSQVMILGTDYLDRFIVPLYLGFNYNAIYAFALIIPNQIHAFFKIFNNLGQPKIASISSRNLWKNIVAKSIQLEIVIFAIIFIYLLLAQLIFSLFFPQYKSTATLLSQVLSLSLLYYPSNLFVLGLVKERNTKAIYLVNSSYLILTVLTIFLLIPFYGLWGAIWAKVFTRLIYAFFPVILLYHSLKIGKK